MGIFHMNACTYIPGSLVRGDGGKRDRYDRPHFVIDDEKAEGEKLTLFPLLLTHPILRLQSELLAFVQLLPPALLNRPGPGCGTWGPTRAPTALWGKCFAYLCEKFIVALVVAHR